MYVVLCTHHTICIEEVETVRSEAELGMWQVLWVPVLPEKNSGHRVVCPTKLPNRVNGLCFQSILMITEVPETCSHPGECVHYGD